MALNVMHGASIDQGTKTLAEINQSRKPASIFTVKPKQNALVKRGTTPEAANDYAVMKYFSQTHAPR
jgi:hypothetical protein